MKIAVYGHSFAAKNLLSKHPAWFDIVGEKLGATSVSALGKAGAPVFFTYQKFLEVYKKFDLNIFLVANFGQYTKDVKIISVNGTEMTAMPSSLNAVESVLNRNDITDETKDNYKKIKSWYIANVPDYDMLIRELMLQDLEEKDPRIILISGGASFEYNHKFATDQRKKSFSQGLDTYWNAQMDFWKSKHNLKERNDVIQTHFTPETTKRFADAAYQFITTGDWPPPPGIIESPGEITDYYEISQL